MPRIADAGRPRQNGDDGRNGCGLQITPQSATCYLARNSTRNRAGGCGNGELVG